MLASAQIWTFFYPPLATDAFGGGCLNKGYYTGSCDAVRGGKMVSRQLSGTWDQVCLSAPQSVTACNQTL